MTERNKRRAAERKTRKLKNKQSANQYLTRAAAAHAHMTNQTENPPDRLDPAPPRPVPTHLLDPFEESDVELSDFYARHRAKEAAKIAAILAERNPQPTPETTAPDPDQPNKKPISEAQLNANRANAQHSTGATSPEGKAASARNNFRHGLTQTEGDLVLLEDESKEEYSQSLAAFQDEWKPANPTEQDLVERLASKQWLRRRAMKLQKLYLAHNGQILDYDQFALYRRYEAQHERAYNKALADLIRLHGLRLRQENGFESQRRKNEEHAYRIRALQNREKLQELAIRTAEAKAKLHEAKLAHLLTPPNHPQTRENTSKTDSAPAGAAIASSVEPASE